MDIRVADNIYFSVEMHTLQCSFMTFDCTEACKDRQVVELPALVALGCHGLFFASGIEYYAKKTAFSGQNRGWATSRESLRYAQNQPVFSAKRACLYV
jgi:hypothetical protein